MKRAKKIMALLLFGARSQSFYGYEAGKNHIIKTKNNNNQVI